MPRFLFIGSARLGLLLVCIAVVSACTAAPPGRAPAPVLHPESQGVPLKRAIIDVDDVRRVIALDTILRRREGQAVPAGASWFTVLEGDPRVVVTAPHATRPFRDGAYRFSDGGGTAALAVALHQVCGVTVLHTTHDSPSDPNYYDDNDFKRRLGELLRTRRPVVVLDIHASHPYRPYELDIGTMHGASLLGHDSLVAALANAFRREGITNLSSNWFAAVRNQTIVKYSAAAGVPAMQLELSALRVSPAASDDHAHRFAQTLQALAEFLGELDACTRPSDPSLPSDSVRRDATNARSPASVNPRKVRGI